MYSDPTLSEGAPHAALCLRLTFPDHSRRCRIANTGSARENSASAKILSNHPCRQIRLATDKTQADLILVLSASPPRGDHIIYSGGQTGTIDNSGHIHEDPVPNYLDSGLARAAYLTVFDAKTGKSLWTDFHQWGGLLTGHNSAGARLISKLKKEMKK